MPPAGKPIFWRWTMSESLHLTRNGPILEITLDRPKANAIDAKTSFAIDRKSVV